MNATSVNSSTSTPWMNVKWFGANSYKNLTFIQGGAEYRRAARTARLELAAHFVRRYVQSCQGCLEEGVNSLPWRGWTWKIQEWPPHRPTPRLSCQPCPAHALNIFSCTLCESILLLFNLPYVCIFYHFDPCQYLPNSSSPRRHGQRLKARFLGLNERPLSLSIKRSKLVLFRHD